MSDCLHRLFAEQGQSPWLDNLQRGYITSGHLDAIINTGIRGLTSNPTIFQKAIQGSADYDEQFASATAAGMSTLDAYWDLVTKDIDGALDAFEPLYESSLGLDGFVSVEVDPSLANDGTATLAAAQELHNRISRPNVMIKIPATIEGIPAIESMIAQGCNVNVTLIFSLERYQQVMDAYISGLEKRLVLKLPISTISSVASFFISRVDTEIDRRLEAIATPNALSLCGTAAISQARLAYQLFEQTFKSARWKKLAQNGAQMQRPLWASTSTKNVAYPDTMYVDELIGPHTVNTLPEATLAAFVQRGTVECTITADLDGARERWGALGACGVQVDDVAAVLEREGVSSFQKSFDELMTALSTKALNTKES
ncbi:MAG: transaldolase [Ilumatobacteraceae bacterium]|nr:transaldolase [Ilumatobacteraceae bacterium]